MLQNDSLISHDVDCRQATNLDKLSEFKCTPHLSHSCSTALLATATSALSAACETHACIISHRKSAWE